MIKDNIQKQMIDAMKAHDEVRLSTLRMLISGFNYEKIAKQHELTDEEEMDVVRKEAKKRKDSIEAYGQIKDIAQRDEKINAEKAELKILEEFLPEQLSDADLLKIVDESIKQINATTMADMGKVIGLVMNKAKGKVEGSRVSQIIKQKLS